MWCFIFAPLPWLVGPESSLAQMLANQSEWEAILWPGFLLGTAGMLLYGLVAPSIIWRLRGLWAAALFWASALLVFFEGSVDMLPRVVFLGLVLMSMFTLTVEVARRPIRGVSNV
jgi:hypothetical protein